MTKGEMLVRASTALYSIGAGKNPLESVLMLADAQGCSKKDTLEALETLWNRKEQRIEVLEFREAKLQGTVFGLKAKISALEAEIRVDDERND
jgi:hypothetical protein